MKFSEKTILLISVVIAGLCSIMYELELSTASSYFLGDSVKQFSLVIGIYMAAMGLGSYLSKYLEDFSLVAAFIVVEVLLGFVGGFSVPIAYFAFNKLSILSFQWLILFLTMLIGLLTGLEVPLLARILKSHYPLKTNLANVLSLDYIGALVATLLFPFIFLPKFGLFRTSLFFGLVNIGLGYFMLRFLGLHVEKRTKRWINAAIITSALLFGLAFYFSKPLIEAWQRLTFSHEVIWSTQSPYQHLAVTKHGGDIRLYLNRIIQFSSTDEYRYHESLALMPLEVAQHREKVLILGGGEGLLAREVLKYKDVQEVTIVDLDTAVFQLAVDIRPIADLNKNALLNPKVRKIATDASVFLRQTEETFDVILADLPDPSTEAVTRLYSIPFFELAHSKLRPNGVFATQATSPFHTKKAFWSIYETVKAAGFTNVLPYHAYVPTFGEWGFVMAADWPILQGKLPQVDDLHYLDSVICEKMFYFEQDMRPEERLEPNDLDRPILLNYYLEDWNKWSREKLNL